MSTEPITLTATDIEGLKDELACRLLAAARDTLVTLIDAGCLDERNQRDSGFHDLLAAGLQVDSIRRQS